MAENTTPQPERSQRAIYADQFCNSYYDIEGQRDGESDGAFVSRVAGTLRSRGKLIEAHEAQNGCRWDSQSTPDGAAEVMAGLRGAAAIALNPQARYGANSSRHTMDEARDGETILGDEYVAGKYLQLKEENPDPSPDAMMLMMKLFSGM